MTYCACCVENFKHTLLAIDLHLLQEKEKWQKRHRGSLIQMMQGLYFQVSKHKCQEDARVCLNGKQGRKERWINRSMGRGEDKAIKRADAQNGWEEGEPAGQQLPVSSSHSEGTLTFLYESSIVGSYFSTKIPWTNWTVCEEKTETTSRLTSDQISGGGTKWPGKKTRRSPWCSEWNFINRFTNARHMCTQTKRPGEDCVIQQVYRVHLMRS